MYYVCISLCATSIVGLSCAAFGIINDDNADQQNSRDKLRSVYAPINGDVKFTWPPMPACPIIC